MGGREKGEEERWLGRVVCFGRADFFGSSGFSSGRWVEVFIQERGYVHLLKKLAEVVEMEWRFVPPLFKLISSLLLVLQHPSSFSFSSPTP